MLDKDQLNQFISLPPCLPLSLCPPSFLPPCSETECSTHRGNSDAEARGSKGGEKGRGQKSCNRGVQKWGHGPMQVRWRVTEKSWLTRCQGDWSWSKKLKLRRDTCSCRGDPHVIPSRVQETWPFVAMCMVPVLPHSPAHPFSEPWSLTPTQGCHCSMKPKRAELTPCHNLKQNSRRAGFQFSFYLYLFISI